MPRLPTALLAPGLAAALPGLPGCYNWLLCRDQEIGVAYHSEETLTLDDEPADTGVASVLLVGELRYMVTGKHCVAEDTLIDVGENTFALPEDAGFGALPTCLVRTWSWQCQMEDFELSFALVPAGGEAPAESLLPPVTVPGGADSAELWNDWTVQLWWWGPEATCI